MIVNVPVIKSVDLLVVGGGLAGVRAALAARQHGFTVFCATPMPYFAEEYCAHFDLQGHDGEDWLALFPEEGKLFTPMDVKRRVEELFMREGVDFLYQLHPVCGTVDGDGNLSGLIVADRSGFQAIQAKVILDATENGLAAKACGAPMTAFHPGIYEVVRYQLGGANGTRVERLPQSYQLEGHEVPVYKITDTFEIPAYTPHELSRIECEARVRSWHPDMTAGSDAVIIKGLPTVIAGYAPTVKFPLAVAGRTDTVTLLRMLGTQPFRAMVATDLEAVSGLPELVRKDRFHRFGDRPTVPLNLDSFAVDDSCEVLVVGGGTGGAPAAISAARAGAQTICLESLSDLGGIMTVGRICVYYFGNRVGYTHEIDEAILGMSAERPLHDMKRGASDIEAKKQYFVKAAWEAGAELRFGTMAVAAAVDGSKVCGVLTVGPFGVRRLAAERIIDATGNADVAAAAGAQTVMASAAEPSVQGAGMSPIRPGRNWNTDYQFICDHDILDCTKAFVMARAKFKSQFDMIQIMNTRERRRIVGDIVLQPSDFYANRKYDDTVVQARSNFDTHGYVVHPLFMLQPPTHDAHFANVPFRALLPKGLENIAATGLAVSAQRDCLPLIRMQPDVQNQGYAVGYAAALAVKGGQTFREVDMRAVQRHLVEKGNLTAEVLDETDDIPGVPAEDPHYELATIFMNPQAKMADLQAAYTANPDDVRTAQVLAFLGEKRVKPTLIKALAAAKWDEGWNYRGMGQFGMSVSAVDCLLFALTAIGGDADTVRAKLETLWPDEYFSHFRAVCFALMKAPDPSAVPLLEELLRTPGMSGYAIRTLRDAVRANRRDEDDTTYRNSQLKEFYLAKALAACEPGNQLAKTILDGYREGLMGYFSLYA